MARSAIVSNILSGSPGINQNHPRAGAKKANINTAPNALEPQTERAPRAKDGFRKSPIISNRKPAPVIGKVALRPKTASEFLHIAESQTKKPPCVKSKRVIKSETYTFNHTHEFAINDKKLWARKIGESHWEAIYFDSRLNELPVFIDSDGANLIVIDQYNQVHYKKVLEEYRMNELIKQKRLVELLSGSTDNTFPYVAIDISGENNWESRWFTLPVVHQLTKLFVPERLIIPKDAIAVAISHRGRYNDYVQDKINQRHDVSTGVTTLYALDKNGQDIHKFDPWSPPWAKTSISLPENEKTSFFANNISVSASTIMAIGYEREWLTGNCELKILTHLADIDTEGGNPGLKYSYADSEDPQVRVLPMDSGWREHPLHLQGQGKVTKNITITQIGEGNDARELFVEGCNPDGIWGYYHKRLSDKDWSFASCEASRDEVSIAPLETDATQSSVKNYEGQLGAHRAKLLDFGTRSNHSKIEVEFNSEIFTLDLYRRYCFASFLGRDRFQYDLVLPDADGELFKVFGNRKAIEVQVKQTNSGIKIFPKNITHKNFTFSF